MQTEAAVSFIPIINFNDNVICDVQLLCLNLVTTITIHDIHTMNTIQITILRIHKRLHVLTKKKYCIHASMEQLPI